MSTVVLPWLGGRMVRLGSRAWQVAQDGRRGDLRLRDQGWYRWRLSGRQAALVGTATRDEFEQAHFRSLQVGYLVGDRFLSDATRVSPAPGEIALQAEAVALIDEDVGRFERVTVGAVRDFGERIYVDRAWPTGAEEIVLRAFEDGRPNLAGIRDVCPALDAAFRLARFQVAETARRRAEQAAFEEELRREAVAQERAQSLQTAEGRRLRALTDFAEAAYAALAVGGAEYLSHRKLNGNEFAVRYRIGTRRLECVVTQALQVIDAGVCLQDHRTGVRGDKWFTLESLPGVVREAERRGVLVVFRHV